MLQVFVLNLCLYLLTVILYNLRERNNEGRVGIYLSSVCELVYRLKFKQQYIIIKSQSVLEK
jgi:hypothetical protein